MARVTVEDCILKVPNRFDLVLRAAQRARSISAGTELTVDRDNDKNPVVALREIAEGTVDVDELEEGLIKNMQRHVEIEEPEEDEMDIDAIEQELSGEVGEAAVETVEKKAAEEGGDDAGAPAEDGEAAPEEVATPDATAADGEKSPAET